MAEPASQTLEIGHPAPLQHKAPQWQLFGAILVAPAFWMLQLLIGFAFSSYLCFPDVPRSLSATVPGWMGPLLIVANVVGLVLSAIALALGWRLLSLTAHEHQHSGGVVDAGEGRTRFLAIWGLIISAMFLVAILFNTINLALVPTCLS